MPRLIVDRAQGEELRIFLTSDESWALEYVRSSYPAARSDRTDIHYLYLHALGEKFELVNVTPRELMEYGLVIGQCSQVFRLLISKIEDGCSRRAPIVIRDLFAEAVTEVVGNQ